MLFDLLANRSWTLLGLPRQLRHVNLLPAVVNSLPHPPPQGSYLFWLASKPLGGAKGGNYAFAYILFSPYGRPSGPSPTD